MTQPRDPQAVLFGTRLVQAQGLGIVAGGIYLIVRSFTSHVNDLTVDVFGIVMALAFGAALIWLARALEGGAGFARTPIYLVEFLTVPIGIGLFQGHQWGWGVVVLGSGLLAFFLLVRGLPKPGDEG